MKKILLLLTILFTTFTQAQYDAVSKSIIPQTVQFASKEIKLNGVGNRTKLWFDVYTQALYLTNPSSDANEIINSNSTMGMIFHMVSPLVTAKKFNKNLNASLRKTVGDSKWMSFKSELDLLEEFVSKGDIVKGDIFNIIYNDTDASIWIIKNGILQGKIPGFEFKKAFFGIWLSDKPVNENLKNELLGKKEVLIRKLLPN
jgi:Chalcone isomerase-like